MHPTNINPNALTVLRQTPAVLTSLLTGLTPDALHQPNLEGWSVKNVLAHLHDAEGIAFTVRIRRMIDEGIPFITSIDPSARLRDLGYGTRSTEDQLAELTAQREANVARFETLTPVLLVWPGRHDTAGTVTPAAIVHQWAFHDLARLRQIKEMLQADMTPGMANTRMFYPEAEALYARRTPPLPGLGEGVGGEGHELIQPPVRFRYIIPESGMNTARIPRHHAAACHPRAPAEPMRNNPRTASIMIVIG
jgi:hypothetical protein